MGIYVNSRTKFFLLSKQFFMDRDFLPLVDSDDFSNQRQVHKRMKLKPGSYVIIPSTYSPNKDSEFLLRIFSEKQPVDYKRSDVIRYWQ